MDPDKTMSTKELTQAVGVLLERDETRAAQERRNARRRIRQRRKQREEQISQLAKSVEVIKWCLVSITTVIVVALFVVIMVVMEVEREAERIKGEVQVIQREAELIRERIRHPFETMGSKLGRQLESKLGLLGDDETQD